MAGVTAGGGGGGGVTGRVTRCRSCLPRASALVGGVTPKIPRSCGKLRGGDACSGSTPYDVKMRARNNRKDSHMLSKDAVGTFKSSKRLEKRLTSPANWAS